MNRKITPASVGSLLREYRSRNHHMLAAYSFMIPIFELQVQKPDVQTGVLMWSPDTNICILGQK